MTQWQALPPEIKMCMLANQEAQTGTSSDEQVFIDNITACEDEGGFDWDNSFEETGPETIDCFWHEVLINDNYELFYQKYPRKPLQNYRIKSEHEALYKKTFRVNRILDEEIDFEKIKALGLEHILEKATSPNWMTFTEACYISAC